ncbi:MAG: CapA family protein [Clostridia bacterium]|nr:CapA family protein [Clostridia bacterium]
MKKKQNAFFFRVSALLLIFCLLTSAFCACGKAPSSGDMEDSGFEMMPAETETPSVEPPRPVATASLGVVGDILIHDTVYNSAKAAGGGAYDFTEQYELVAPYLKKYDLSVANL